MPETYKILVVDDEPDIRHLLGIVLEKEGYTVIEAENGEQALELVRSDPDFSLIIMDIMMPVMNGVSAATEIRAISSLPILFLTAKSADQDKMLAFGSGGDDYIVKPFYATDLKLRVSALLRRWNTYRSMSEPVRTEGPGRKLEINAEEKTVYRQGEKIFLTEKEFELLSLLQSRRGHTFSPVELYETIWQETYLPSSSNTVLVHIANLRKKLGEEQNIIRTVWGKGYVID
ncbi:MAG: response regulator transcription factor [Ruminococcaceae bacterium]|nr:response regulator transcription factor [Oscillospiraceae bacterium]